jgi:hypothetical protein
LDGWKDEESCIAICHCPWQVKWCIIRLTEIWNTSPSLFVYQLVENLSPHISSVPRRVRIASCGYRRPNLLAFGETAHDVWTIPLDSVFDICLLIGIGTFSWSSDCSWRQGLASCRMDQRSISIFLGRQRFSGFIIHE